MYARVSYAADDRSKHKKITWQEVKFKPKKGAARGRPRVRVAITCSPLIAKLGVFTVLGDVPIFAAFKHHQRT